jgi:hypothetical protein
MKWIHGTQRKYKNYLEYLEERDHLGDVGIYGRIILK